MDSEITHKKRTVSEQAAANCVGMSSACRLTCLLQTEVFTFCSS